MASTTLFLARHGSHDRLGRVMCGRMEGVSVNAEGRRQAAWLVERLADDKLAAVYASPLTRAGETAAPVARAQGLELTIDPDLDEIDFGAWTGLSFDTLHGRDDWTAWNRDRPHARPPGGESMVEVQARVARFLERVRNGHAGEAVCAVAHGDVIKAAVAWALDLPLQSHFRFAIDPGSLSALSLSAAEIKVMWINERPRS